MMGAAKYWAMRKSKEAGRQGNVDDDDDDGQSMANVDVDGRASMMMAGGARQGRLDGRRA